MRRIVQKLTIQRRVAILICGSLFSLGFLLVLFINLIAPLLITSEVGVPDTLLLVSTVNAYGTPITVIKETPAPKEHTISPTTSVISTDPLRVVRVLSLVGLIMIVVIGIFSSKWIAGLSLRPIVKISQQAKQIDARSLHHRLKYNGPLDEVKILADTIDAMLDRLEMNFERQGQFIGNLTHELRTPLSSLRMNIEALILDPEARLEDYYMLAETAERALSRLEQLVEDLLLLAKGENEISHQPVVLGSLIDEILEELSPLAQEHNISLKMSGEIDSEINGDAVLLHSAILNLVKNGILYNHPGGFVEILIGNDETEVRVEVIDNGIGISPDVQTNIFERFYRANKGTLENIHGKGLGLSITKHIVELHKGSIDVESTLGIGSKFRIFLPKCC